MISTILQYGKEMADITANNIFKQWGSFGGGCGGLIGGGANFICNPFIS
jgi:hypothetical protein